MDNSTIEFERKAYREILVWKQNLAGKTALLVEGARRVSKTHLVKRFAQQEYESFIYIDFSAKGKQIRAYRRAFAVTHHTCTEIMEHVPLVVGHEVDLTQHGLLAKKVPRFVYHEATPPEFGRVLNPDGRNLIVALTFLYVGELRVRDVFRTSCFRKSFPLCSYSLLCPFRLLFS